MTYSLNTLNTDNGTPAPSGLRRFAHEIVLMLSAAVLLFWLIALLSYSLNDPAWSTSGIGAPVRNWGGQLGAWLSDASYYLFGLSVWWLYLAAGRAWLTSLARWLRGGDDADASPAVRWWQRPSLQRAAFWGALVVLVTNLRDEDDEELLTAVKRIGRQHRVLVASLREEVLDQLRQSPVQTLPEALAYSATVNYLNSRAELHERLSAHGVALLDARPGELGAELVGRYLSWKKAGSL